MHARTRATVNFMKYLNSGNVSVLAGEDNFSTRHVLYLAGLTLLGVFVLSIAWEFLYEDLISGNLGGHYHPEETGERWEYVATVMVFTAVALVVPVLVSGKVIRRNVRTEQKIKSLASFPEHSPNPTLRFGSDNVLLYANAASTPFLDAIQCAVGDSVPVAWTRALNDLPTTGNQGRLEYACSGRTFSILLHPMPEAGYVDVYAHDITERIWTEDALHTVNERLEQRVNERTSKLSREIAEREQAQAALRVSEHRYRDIAESSSDWIWEMDEELRFSHYSPRLAEITGVRPEELIGKTRRDLGKGEIEDEKWHRHLMDLDARRPFRDFRYTYKHEDGRTLHFSTSGKPVFDEDGRFKGYRGTGSDITERQQAEAALSNSEQRFRNLVEGSIQGILIHRDRKPLYVNQAWADIHGYTVDEVMAMDSVDGLISEEDRARMAAYRARRMHGEEVPTWYEYQAVQKDGSLIWLENRTSITTWDGEPAIFSCVVDITERKRAEDALQKSEARFRAVLDNSPTKIHIKDEEGRYLLINRQAEILYGITDAEARCRTSYDIFPKEVADSFAGHDQRVIETGHTVEEEEEWHLPDGVRTYLTVKFPILDADGNVTSVGAIGTDITERKKADEERAELGRQLVQSQKMDAIGQLTGGIAHDFNNLLMIIDGYSNQAIQQIKRNGPAKESLAHVVEATDKAAILTQQLLVFSRRQIMEKGVVALDGVLRETLGLLERSVGERHDLKLEMDDGDICAETDSAQLGQAVMNLVINARDAMPRGGSIVVGLRVAEVGDEFTARHRGMTPGRYAEIFVKDQGSGIDPKDLPHIFEPFFTTKAQGKGTGLGLAMVYGFAQQSGMVVDVSSEPGKGSIFRLYLPTVDREPEVALPDVGNLPRGNGEVILLVEDDLSLLKLSSRTLDDLGYTVLTASDGFEALEVDDEIEGPIHLLLSDVVMPNLGGFELADILQKARPDMKIVFISGYPSNDHVPGTGIPKHATFLQKPVKQDVLARTIHAVLERDALCLAG